MQIGWRRQAHMPRGLPGDRRPRGLAENPIHRALVGGRSAVEALGRRRVGRPGLLEAFSGLGVGRRPSTVLRSALFGRASRGGNIARRPRARWQPRSQELRRVWPTTISAATRAVRVAAPSAQASLALDNSVKVGHNGNMQKGRRWGRSPESVIPTQGGDAYGIFEFV